MPFVYIIFSQKLNKYYVSACKDLQRRIYEHNIGHSKFTSAGIPWVLKLKKEIELLFQRFTKAKHIDIKYTNI